MDKEFSKSEKAAVEGLLRGLATALGFTETRKGLYSVAVDEDTTAFIDFRGTWKGWRYAFKGGRALSDEELMGIEPLRLFKKLRDRIIGDLDEEGEVSLGHSDRKGMGVEAGKGLILPVAGMNELSQGLKFLTKVKSKILVEEDYIYLDENGNRVSRDKAVTKRLRRSGLRKLAYAYGLNYFIIGMKRYNGEKGDDEEFTWICRALIFEPKSKRYVESIGACSSKDPFFTRTPSEADVILRAQTLAVSRGIADLLGLEVIESRR
jgi:hypothetical protein